MARPDLISLADAERRDLVDLLAGLAPGDWDVSTPGGRRVRDLVADALGHEQLRPPTVLSALVGGRSGRAGAGLCTTMVLAQDLRRALGRPRVIPAERLRTALDVGVGSPVLGARKRVRDLQLIADDVDWTYGRGWVLRGPGEAVLMAIAGRAEALRACTGPGVPRLRNRLARSSA